MVKIGTKLTVVISKDDNCFIATCMENNMTSKGYTWEEALDNIQEVLSVCYEDENCDVDVKRIYQAAMAAAG